MSERAPLSGPLGILMLETRFPRIVGDVGNAASYDFPVIFRTMQGIGSADAVTAHPDRPRVLAALLEHGVQPDGSVKLPAVLHPYLGGRTHLAPPTKS